MAGGDKSNRTLPPSPRRRKEARRKGQVPRSTDLAGWASLLAFTFVMPPIFHLLATRLVGLVDAGVADFATPTRASALRLLSEGLDVAIVGSGLVAVVLVGLVAVVEVAQARPALAWDKLKPTLENLSPAKGFKRQFSATTAMELPKQVAKLAMVGVVAVVVVKGVLDVAGVGYLPPFGALLSLTGDRLLSLARYVALAGTALGIADWVWKRRQIESSLKMSPHDLKEENRQEEGSPESKRARRQAQIKLHRSRLTGSVEGADVVVVNPTHVAVGFSYASGTDAAPRVVARGVDAVALALKERARQAGIPVVTDAGLARAVHAACVVGDVIPVELYAAVARLLAQVYSLRATAVSP